MRFYSEYASRWKAALEAIQTLPPPSVRSVPRGILLPLQKRDDCSQDLNCYQGGVTDGAFNFVAGIERRKGAEFYNLACKKSYVAVGIDVRHERVVFGGVIFGHFGHEIIDGMTRLWHYARHHDDNLKRVFLVQPGASTKHAESFFKLAGMNYEIIKQPTQFPEVIIPDEAYRTGDGGNPAWLEWFGYVMKKAGKHFDTDKIYLTRTQWPAGDGVGEEYYERFFESEGYKVIAPEKLSLADQIRYISGATHIACTMGTMAHMLVFARPDADVTILLRSPSSIMPAQLTINRLRGYKWRMIDATRNPLPTGQSNGCFLYEPTTYFYQWAKENKFRTPDMKDLDIDEDANFFAYLEKWAKRFSDPVNYKYIKNRTMKDAVDSLTKYFEG